MTPTTATTGTEACHGEISSDGGVGVEALGRGTRAAQVSCRPRSWSAAELERVTAKRSEAVYAEKSLKTYKYPSEPSTRVERFE